MTRAALLGAFVIVFCVAGLALGIVRLAPGSTLTDAVLAVAAGFLGVAVLLVVLRLGRRGTPPWTRWLIVPLLISAFWVDRLPERWQLALVVFGAGYVLAFLVTVVVRAVQLTR
jgi:hypothetical protein